MQRCAKVIDMHSHHMDTRCVAVAVCVAMRFILLSTVACIRDVIDYDMTSIPVIKSQDDLVL